MEIPMSPPKYAHVEFVNSNQVLQPNELRVGNFVAKRIFTVGMPDYYIIDPVDAEYIFKVSTGKSECNGVVLTPEILEKAGLSNMESFLGVYRIKIDEMLIDIPMGKNKAAPHAKYKYVHQLQNLYHSLTGTELKIEL